MPVIGRVQADPIPAGLAAAAVPAWLPVLLLLAAFALLRLPYLASVEPDDADLILFSQQLAWGYSEQPPLYSWLCEAAFRAFGCGAAALVIVHTAILAGILLVLHAVARMAIADRRLSLLAACSVLLIPSLAWHALTYLTHSNLLFLTSLLTLYAALRLVRDGRTRDYMLLGVACAAGMLSKYNFAVYAAALLLAGLTVPAARARLLDRRMLIAFALTLLLLVPHAMWIVNQHAALLQILEMKLSKPRDPSVPGRLASLRGFAELAMNVLAAAALPAFAARWLHAGSKPRTPEGFAEITRTLLLRFLIVALLLLTVQVFASQSDRFHERWLMPFALVLPVWLFARIHPAAIPAARLRAFAMLLALAAAGYTAARAVQVGLFLDHSSGLYPLRLEFADLAAAIADDAGPQPTIITAEREIGGNLLLHLPQARVRCPMQPLFDPGPGRGPVVLAWNLAYTRGEPVPPWELFQRYPEIVPRPIAAAAVRVLPVSRGREPSRVAFVVLHD